MALTLAQFEARVAALLYDAGAAVWTTAALDEGIRLALHEYTQANPYTTETYITLPAAGREIALSSLTGLLQVTDVWWPFNPDSEVWPPNQVRGFRVWWDDGAPLLFLNTFGRVWSHWSAGDGAQPQANDSVRVWYTRLQTIQNLDSAATTSIPGDHESILVQGAAGYCCAMRSIDLAEQSAHNVVTVSNYELWSKRFLELFFKALDGLRKHGTVSGDVWGKGWALDKWDLQA